MDKLFSYALNEWLNDIKKNQLPGLLGGVGPIHSLVQLGQLKVSIPHVFVFDRKKAPGDRASVSVFVQFRDSGTWSGSRLNSTGKTVG